MAEFKASIYRNHEDSQHGHSFESKSFLSASSGGDLDAVTAAMQAVLYAKQNVRRRPECAEISCSDHEGFPGAILSLSIDTENKNSEFSMDDFWMYPDPNYHGEKYPSSHFWGTVGKFKEQMGEEAEMER